MSKYEVLDAELLSNIKELITKNTGLEFRDHDHEKFSKVIKSRIEFYKLVTPEEYYLLLKNEISNSRSDEWRELTVLLTVGESYFFRDKRQFSLLSGKILPALIERRKKVRELRIWSAGCATGEEAYSLAILLNEMKQSLNGWEITILGTDIKKEFLAKAISGSYGWWSFRVMPENMEKKCFSKKKNTFQINDGIRQMVTFSFCDLLRDKFPSIENGIHDMDLILCRNVFIYYNKKAITTITEKLANSLNESGYLITGHGELFSVNMDPLKTRVFDESVVYEKAAESRTKAASAELPKVFPQKVLMHEDPKTSSSKIVEFKEKKKLQSFIPDFLSQASLLYREMNYKDAIEKAESVLIEEPNNYYALYLIGSARANMGDYDRALFFLRKAIESDRLAAEPHYMMSNIARQRGKLEESKNELKKVIYLNQAHIPAYLELADIYEIQRYIERARRLRETALKTLMLLPENSTIEPYEHMTAKELIDYVRRILSQSKE
ncbi:MAG: hypothetical protein HZA77_07560 [Candidatus Schekmanbacteria bacterium]|nr:hypothetical protein [Candidatus Schekmanbacteria bacterium]